jgi:hypothetical protein
LAASAEVEADADLRSDESAGSNNDLVMGWCSPAGDCTYRVRFCRMAAFEGSDRGIVLNAGVSDPARMRGDAAALVLVVVKGVVGGGRAS